MQRVFVTGGAGFIGSHVVAALLARGCQVMSYDCLIAQVHPQSPNWPEYQSVVDGLTLHFGDVRSPPAVMYALEEFRPDTVIHLAAMVGVGQSQHEAALYTSANVTGTANLLQRVLDYNAGVRDRAGEVESLLKAQVNPGPDQSPREAQELYLTRIQPVMDALLAKPTTPISQVFVAGSMSSYGEGPYDVDEDVTDEDERGRIMAAADDWVPGPGQWNPKQMTPAPTHEWWPMTPASIYAWTKQQQEELAMLLWRTRGQREGLAIKVGRFFNTYGSNQSLTNPYTGAAAIFSARVKAGLAPVVFEDGGQLRDFTHVSDVAAAVLAILDAGEPGQSYNVCTGVPTSILQVATAICAGTGLVPEVTQVRRVGDIRHCYGDASKLRALGWVPSTNLTDGLVALREWVGAQPVDLTAELLDRANADLLKHGLLVASEDDVGEEECSYCHVSYECLENEKRNAGTAVQ